MTRQTLGTPTRLYSFPHSNTEWIRITPSAPPVNPRPFAGDLPTHLADDAVVAIDPPPGLDIAFLAAGRCSQRNHLPIEVRVYTLYTHW
jgi:hypothetical protein